MKKAYIELTEEQKEKLVSIQDYLMESNRRGKPCLVLAQVLFVGADAIAVVGTIPHDKAIEIQKALKASDAGKMMTMKMQERRLAKARLDK